MRLRADAREFVSLSVKKEFKKELLDAEAAVEKLEAWQKETFRKFKSELDKMRAKWTKELSGLVKRHGLTWRKDKGPDHGAHLLVFEDGSGYNGLDAGSFDETASGGTGASAARGAVAEIRNRITRATAKALFEIEVRGNRNDIDDIVGQVIDEIRKEKQQ